MLVGHPGEPFHGIGPCRRRYKGQLAARSKGETTWLRVLDLPQPEEVMSLLAHYWPNPRCRYYLSPSPESNWILPGTGGVRRRQRFMGEKRVRPEISPASVYRWSYSGPRASLLERMTGVGPAWKCLEGTRLTVRPHARREDDGDRTRGLRLGKPSLNQPSSILKIGPPASTLTSAWPVYVVTGSGRRRYVATWPIWT